MFEVALFRRRLLDGYHYASSIENIDKLCNIKHCPMSRRVPLPVISSPWKSPLLCFGQVQVSQMTYTEHGSLSGVHIHSLWTLVLFIYRTIEAMLIDSIWGEGHGIPRDKPLYTLQWSLPTQTHRLIRAPCRLLLKCHLPYPLLKNAHITIISYIYLPYIGLKCPSYVYTTSTSP